MRVLATPFPSTRPLKTRSLANLPHLLPHRVGSAPHRLAVRERHHIDRQTRRLAAEPEVVHRPTGRRIRHPATRLRP